MDTNQFYNEKPLIKTDDDFYDSYWYNLQFCMYIVQDWTEEKWMESEEYNLACQNILQRFYFFESKEDSVRYLIKILDELPLEQRFSIVYNFQRYLFENNFCCWHSHKFGVDQVRYAFEKIFSAELIDYFINTIFNQQYGVIMGLDEEALPVWTSFGFISQIYPTDHYESQPKGSIWYTDKPPEVIPSYFYKI